MGISEKLRVTPRGFSLASRATASTPGVLSEKAAIAATEKIAKKIRDLQLRLYAEGQQSLLIVLQGLDAAGKDGTISFFHATGETKLLSEKVEGGMLSALAADVTPEAVADIRLSIGECVWFTVKTQEVTLHAATRPNTANR
jgi:hypothetical protein